MSPFDLSIDDAPMALTDVLGPPIGTIRAIHQRNGGPPIAVPYGWALCDGPAGTPDLRDKFIMGGEVADIGTTGGHATHGDGTNDHDDHDLGGGSPYSFGAGGQGMYGHSETDNRPPFYQLAFIIRKNP